MVSMDMLGTEKNASVLNMWIHEFERTIADYRKQSTIHQYIDGEENWSCGLVFSHIISRDTVLKSLLMA